MKPFLHVALGGHAIDDAFYFKYLPSLSVKSASDEVTLQFLFCVFMKGRVVLLLSTLLSYGRVSTVLPVVYEVPRPWFSSFYNLTQSQVELGPTPETCFSAVIFLTLWIQLRTTVF